MRRFHLILFTIASLSVLGACVASVDNDPEEGLDVTSEVESAIELEPHPLCPDQVFRLRYSEECFTPRGRGTRECTDTITQHRAPVFKVTGMECKTVDTTVTTSCGFCIVLELPGDPGEDLPPF